MRYRTVLAATGAAVLLAAWALRAAENPQTPAAAPPEPAAKAQPAEEK